MTKHHVQNSLRWEATADEDTSKVEKTTLDISIQVIMKCLLRHNLTYFLDYLKRKIKDGKILSIKNWLAPNKWPLLLLLLLINMVHFVLISEVNYNWQIKMQHFNNNNNNNI